MPSWEAPTAKYSPQNCPASTRRKPLKCVSTPASVRDSGSPPITTTWLPRNSTKATRILCNGRKVTPAMRFRCIALGPRTCGSDAFRTRFSTRLPHWFCNRMTLRACRTSQAATGQSNAMPRRKTPCASSRTSFPILKGPVIARTCWDSCIRTGRICSNRSHGLMLTTVVTTPYRPCTRTQPTQRRITDACGDSGSSPTKRSTALTMQGERKPQHCG